MARERLSRNSPCPCGSGKKYKHCCHNKGFEWVADDGTVSVTGSGLPADEAAVA